MIFRTLFLGYFLALSLSDVVLDLSNYSYPHPLSTPTTERIAIFATNDIHGHLIPDINLVPDSNQTYNTGGATLMSSYLQALEREWGSNLVWLDAGDQYQGTMESNLFVGEPIVKFINYMNLTRRTIAAIGNHDFDFGYKNMSKSFSEADFPYVSANIYNRSTEKYWDFVNTSPEGMIEVAGIKIGVIGLSTVFTPQTTATDVGVLDFKDYVNITIAESQKLKRKGAQIVLIACHVGLFCENGDLDDALRLEIRNVSSKQKSFCVTTDELYTFLQQIPSNTVDAVIGGHFHTIVHHWINGIPVILGDCNARHFNVLYLTFDRVSGRIIPDLTEIEGPVPVCEYLIDDTQTCYVNTTLTNLSSSTFYPFTFHNSLISEDLSLRSMMSLYIDTAQKYREMVLAAIEEPMTIEADVESALGDFISDAVARSTNTEIALINRGMLRISWSAGNLTYYELYETIPFDDDVSTFEITGSELFQVMSVLQNGTMAFYPTAGLRQYICAANKKLLNLTLINGETIEPNQTYLVGANNFLLKGGDDFTQVLKFYTPRNITSYENIRDAVAGYAQELKVLNTAQKPIVNPEQPRIILVEDCEQIGSEITGGKREPRVFLE